ncbi:MAG: TIGR01212 family radical SAM protein, partial [Clostridia bacterium]|nr:TIGR01212 family radical SAM protein [Clostridia bacterium]
GEFAAPVHLPVDKQIELAKSRVREKYRGGRFIAYFQSFTGTYGEIGRLREIYLAAARREDVAAVSIATRPDCLGEDVMEMLREIAAVKPLWIELGLQTESDVTARSFGRGYPTETYLRGVEKLRRLPVHIITHIILGLPGEDRAQMLRSALFAARHSDGLKLQLLHVLEGTELAKRYRAGEVNLLSQTEYYEIVAEILQTLPEGKVIHRLTGDGDKRLLVAPLWSADKKRVMNQMNQYLKDHGLEVDR